MTGTERQEQGKTGGETALSGLCVVELGVRIGAAACGSLLAQLGATVVAVESVSPSPAPPKMRHREQLAAGKISFAPLLSDEADRELLCDLLARADVVIHCSDTDPEPLGDLLTPSPEQIVCNLTAFGRDGPLAGKPACDAEIQALSGMADATGMPNGAPVAAPLPIVEYLTGMHAAGAVLAALRNRRLTGAGQAIDMALYDCAFAAMSSFLTRLFRPGDAGGSPRIGNRHTLSAPWNVYQAQDGWVQICTGSDVQWRRLCELMACPELSADERFATSIGRVRRVAEVDTIVQGWIGARKVADCVAALSSAAIASGPIVAIDGYPREANLEHRGMIGKITDPDSGRELFIPGSPLAMSRTPGVAPSRLPRLGEDRAAVEALAKTSPPDKAPPPAIAARGVLPLSGIRVIEIGHYTTAPVAARFLASLGAEVIKVEPPEGEASRAWPPLDRGQSLFYTIGNSDKRAVTLDLNTEAGAEALRALLQTADVLIENLKPGALARRGFAPADLERLNSRLIYCAISGFGARSLYASRAAFDTVVQAMSGLMDLVRADGAPVKTGISTADVMGAAMSFLTILAALEWRETSGKGQSIDLSMQDIVAWTTQLAWNGKAGTLEKTPAVGWGDGYALVIGCKLGRESAQRQVPVLSAAEMMKSKQTLARQLRLTLRDERGEWPALATPLRLLGTPPVVQRPGPALGCDNAAILGPLPLRPPANENPQPAPSEEAL